MRFKRKRSKPAKMRVPAWVPAPRVSDQEFFQRMEVIFGKLKERPGFEIDARKEPGSEWELIGGTEYSRNRFEWLAGMCARRVMYREQYGGIH